jgi:hypothetical protein
MAAIDGEHNGHKPIGIRYFQNVSHSIHSFSFIDRSHSHCNAIAARDLTAIH